MLSRSFSGLGMTAGFPEGAGEGSGAQGVGVNLVSVFRTPHGPGPTRPRRPALSQDAGRPGAGERASEQALTGRCRAA